MNNIEDYYRSRELIRIEFEKNYMSYLDSYIKGRIKINRKIKILSIFDKIIL